MRTRMRGLRNDFDVFHDEIIMIATNVIHYLCSFEIYEVINRQFKFGHSAGIFKHENTTVCMDILFTAVYSVNLF